MTIDALREVVLPRLTKIRKSGAGFSACCPAHEDREASLSVSPGRDQPVVLTCHAGCQFEDILAAIDLTPGDLSRPREDHERPSGPDTWMPCQKQDDGSIDRSHYKVAEYLYRDAAGKVVFGVARCARKGDGCQGFRQWRPDPTAKSGRRWSRTLPDGARVGEGIPYRLPEVLDAVKAGLNIWKVEGEKDADRLWSLGYPATCNPQGGSAGKWTKEHAAWLAGADVMIVADRDPTGWSHAEEVANTLLPIARSIEVVRAAAGKDVSDHLDAGLPIRKLVKVAEPKPFPPGCGHDDCPACASAGDQ